MSLSFSRKEVVLEKKEEETFGFEIQVRGLTAAYWWWGGGRGFWTSRVPFNRISLIGQISGDRWILRDWNMYTLLCTSLNPCVCLLLRGWKVAHQSDNPLMLVPWLESREDVFFPSISILSCAVYSHASHVIPASLSGSRFAHLTSVSLWSLSPWSFPTMSALLHSTPVFKPAISC